ncbi:hypothetical protein N7470_003740 [Penicillium chermesinum]|nr:hypothetical protein N7470_003740 [Penicillium chermesinum]
MKFTWKKGSSTWLARVTETGRKKKKKKKEEKEKEKEKKKRKRQPATFSMKSNCTFNVVGQRFYKVLAQQVYTSLQVMPPANRADRADRT